MAHEDLTDAGIKAVTDGQTGHVRLYIVDGLRRTYGEDRLESIYRDQRDEAVRRLRALETEKAEWEAARRA